MLQYSKTVSPRSLKNTSRLIPCIYICQEKANMRRVSVGLFAGRWKQALSAVSASWPALPWSWCPFSQDLMGWCVLQWLWAQAQRCVSIVLTCWWRLWFGGHRSSLFRVQTERNCIHLQNPAEVYPQWPLPVSPCRKFNLFDLWGSSTSPSKMLYVSNNLIQYSLILFNFFLLSFVDVTAK